MVTKKASCVNNIATDLLNFHRLNYGDSVHLEKFISRDMTKSDVSILSNLEEKILRSTQPIRTSDSEEIELNSTKGIWLNKSEEKNWSGTIPLNKYIINQDDDPLVIIKKSYKDMKYMKEIAIRYLR